MDWLKGMNRIIANIEDNLTEQISYTELSRIVGCSVYEFSRIFSFMTGMSVSEYIRRRRLSQSVFDIQNTSDKIIDIALKYRYESPTSFAKAFKELHGTTPSDARKTGVSLKTYPPISFVLTIKGVNEMEFRIEKRDRFQIMGLIGCENMDCRPNCDDTLPSLWRDFMDNYNQRLWNNDAPSYYTAPLWQVGAYDFKTTDGEPNAIIGAEYKGEMPDGMSLKTIPAATWAVFTITSPSSVPYVQEAWARILIEWFPASRYKRDENAPSMEVFPDGDASSMDYKWEIWMPVVSK